MESTKQAINNYLLKITDEDKELYVGILDYKIHPAEEVASRDELLVLGKIRSFLPSHPKQFMSTFNVEGAWVALKKTLVSQNK